MFVSHFTRVAECVLLALASSPTLVPAAELGRWEAGVTTRPQGIVAAVKPIPGWTVQTRAGKTVVRLNPNTSPYQRSAYQVEVSGRLTGPVWLVVEFLDSGYGLITVSPRVAQRDQWGVARVNSGRMRRTVFRYPKPDFPGVVRVEGLDYLRAITLTSSEPPLEQAPLVPPALDFRTPSQRVTTAAGDILDVAFLPERGTIELLETTTGSGPSSIANQIAEAVAGLRNQLPLARALGFNGIESYVRWGFVERQPGVWDWSLYDAILDEIEKHGLQWFPMILAGSGYAIPEWLHDSKHNVGFVCLEHGITHDTQSIFYDYQATYASRFLAEFGKHYGSRRGLLGIRLGPSGDYGEAQYPARGPGYKFRDSHTHIGYWAGDHYAKQSFRKYLRSHYREIETLNTAWNSRYVSFDGVSTFLPENAIARRQRIDFATWYVGAMSEWCERWAVWARDAMPGTVIHQSSGGWGPVEIGTDYSFQARSMAKIRGGMRLTNEADDFADNFSITRMASSAARFYGAALGFEPGGGHGGARGVSARIFNALTSGAEHLFFYQKDISGNDHGCAAWLKYAGMLDQRAKPVIDVAAFYPDTYAKLENELLRYRWGSTFFNVVRALRSEMDFDYASEQMI